MEVFNKMILMNYFATLNPVAFTNALPGNIAQGLIWGIMHSVFISLSDCWTSPI